MVVDYPILLLTLRRPEESLAAAAARIWPTLRLAAVSAAAGLLAMVGSGLPGLVQTGVFAGAGLLTAAATTRWLLPRLVPAETPHRWPGRSACGPLAALRGRPRHGAGGAGRGGRGAGWPPAARTAQRDLAALSPVPARQQALDAELRGQLGAPDVRSLFVLGPTASEGEMLGRSEALAGAVPPLVARGLLAGLDLPSRYLPSPALQASRQAALPGDAALAEALREAAAGLPFRPTAFARFHGGGGRKPRPAAARPRHAGGRRADHRRPALAPGQPARRRGLGHRSGDRRGRPAGAGGGGGGARPARGALPRREAGDGAAAGRLFPGDAGLGAGRRGRGARPARRSGCAARGGRWRVAGPIGGAVLVTLAVLALLGEALSLFHLAALLLLAGLAIDYALFLAAGGRGGWTRTTGAVLTCAVSTLLTFGLLSLSETPVLHGIGLTVATGVAAAFLLACAFTPRQVRSA